MHEKVDGHNVGQHPLISRLLKGIFHDRPPLPRYTNTWNVQTVLNYLEGLGENQFLSLKVLTWKLTMLLALTRPSRSADLSQLDLGRKTYKPDGVCFYPNALAKQSRQGSQIAFLRTLRCVLYWLLRPMKTKPNLSVVMRPSC